MLDVPSCARGAVKGKRPNTVNLFSLPLFPNPRPDDLPQEETLFVVPFSLAESLSIGWCVPYTSPFMVAFCPWPWLVCVSYTPARQVSPSLYRPRQASTRLPCDQRR